MIVEDMTDKVISVIALNDGKAGMDGLDKERINKIIEETSKGSKYYESQLIKQKRIDDRMKDMKERLSHISSPEPVDTLILELEKQRDLSRTIVHVDMDAYYAAVEMLGPPPIPPDVPIAVGSTGMLSTSNYPARKYGVRAGMPGFIAKKLCPHLRIIPPDFTKYTTIAEKIRTVFARYDSNFSPMSLDEAYLDITDYLKNNATDPEKVAETIRQEIYDATGLTASAGIASNALLAKVCSDQNKPNGQFYLKPNRDEIMNFVGKLPVRKVGGIGNVTSQLLKAIGISTCSDLFNKLNVLKVLFSDLSFDNFIHVALGMGPNRLSSERERKSMSTETTFRDTSNESELLNICRDLSNELSQELLNANLRGKCITLKIKTDTFVVKSKAHSIKGYTNEFDLISNTAVQCLRWFFKNIESKPLTLRLMGVRMSEFGFEKKSQGTLMPFLSTSIQKEEDFVACPNCETSLSRLSINQHLDECLLSETKEYLHTSEELNRVSPKLSSPDVSSSKSLYKETKKCAFSYLSSMFKDFFSNL
ncbi:DNA polymerase kappa [Lepeophtheirus salmonis]|uniref:DNA polymerase kappa n=1 Tax=Lepeophtheirus salmonis TaxID=72036 RepID=UPI001AE33C5F|nr:DNA polymerase kappa-like [Lepeophtheirus salmonis]